MGDIPVGADRFELPAQARSRRLLLALTGVLARTLAQASSSQGRWVCPAGSPRPPYSLRRLDRGPDACEQSLVLQVPFFRVEDGMECQVLDPLYFEEVERRVGARAIANDVDEPLGAIETPPKVVAFAHGAAQEAGEVPELRAL